MNFVISIISVLVALLVMGVLISKEIREKFILFLGGVAILFTFFYFTCWKALICFVIMGIIGYTIGKERKKDEKIKKQIEQKRKERRLGYKD